MLLLYGDRCASNKTAPVFINLEGISPRCNDYYIPVIARIPTPTINKPQKTIDKYTLENKELAAITRRDPTIVVRIWLVAENYTAIVILDRLLAHYGYQTLKANC